MKTSTRIIKAIAQTPIVKKIIDLFFDGIRQKYNKKLDDERNRACANYGVEVLDKFDKCMKENNFFYTIECNSTLGTICEQEFNEDFSRYNGENTKLRKAQLRMVEILVEIDKVCRKHNITYWLDYGTLLGAVRHKGFIPWDDDVDICVMRKDYNKIRKCLQEELPKQFLYTDWTTDKYFFSNYGRVRDKKSFCYYPYFVKQKEQGLWVDIFKMEKVPSMKIKKIIDFFYGRVFREIHHYGDVAYKSILRKYFVRFLAYIAFPFVYLMIYFSRILSIFSKGLITPSYSTNPYNSRRYEKYIFPCKELEFEGHKFFVPNNYDAHLKLIYGDYMKVPPVDKRKTIIDLDSIKFYD